MAIVKSAGRQWSQHAVKNITYDEIGSAITTDSVQELFDLPPGARVLNGFVQIVTPYVGPTAATITVGDSTDDDRYSNDTTIDLKGAAGTRTPFTVAAGKNTYYTAGDAIALKYNTTVAAATAGEFMVHVEYVIDGRANETQDR